MSKFFQVFECDDHDKPTSFLGVWEAGTANEAREQASIDLSDPDIVNTGFYSARELDAELLNRTNKEIDNLVKSVTLHNTKQRFELHA